MPASAKLLMLAVTATWIDGWSGVNEPNGRRSTTKDWPLARPHTTSGAPVAVTAYGCVTQPPAFAVSFVAATVAPR